MTGKVSGKGFLKLPAKIMLINSISMCYRVQCQKCYKVTWAGCGKHINETMKGLPKKYICQCPRQESFCTIL